MKHRIYVDKTEREFIIRTDVNRCVLHACIQKVSFSVFRQMNMINHNRY